MMRPVIRGDSLRSYVVTLLCALVLGALAAQVLPAQDLVSIVKRIEALEHKLDEVLQALPQSAAPGGPQASPGSAEAIYDGKPVSVWVRMLADRNDERLKTAQRALIELQEAAVDPLLEALKAEDWYWRRNAVDTLGQLFEHGGEGAANAVVEASKDRHALVRVAAIDAGLFALATATRDLTVIKKGTRPVERDLPALERHVRTLEAALPPALVAALNDADIRVRLRAVRGIADAGVKEEAAVEGLRARLKDSEPLVRREAALALAGLEVEASRDAVPVLADLLKAEIEQVKIAGAFRPESSAQIVAVVRALGALGPRAAGAVSVLEELRDVELRMPGLRSSAMGKKVGSNTKSRTLVMNPHRNEIERALEAIAGGGEGAEKEVKKATGPAADSKTWEEIRKAREELKKMPAKDLEELKKALEESKGKADKE